MATSARLEELKQKFHENPRRYFAPLANEHRKLGDLEQAINLCRAHLPQQPQHVSGHIVLAQALFEAGNPLDARATFELALDLDPENLIALRFLGDIARTQGELQIARSWYERVLDADPRNDEIVRLMRELDDARPSPGAASAGAPRSSEPPPAATIEPNEAPAAEAPPVPIEDLAVAWQHEVAALDSTPAQPPAGEQAPMPEAAAVEPPVRAEFPAAESYFAADAHSESFAPPTPEPPAEQPDAVSAEDVEPTFTTESQFDTEPSFASEPEFSLPEIDLGGATVETPAAQEPNEPVAEPVTAHSEPVTSYYEPLARADEQAAETREEQRAEEHAGAHSEALGETHDEEPGETWAEPSEEFVASVPEVTSEAPPAPPVFREIDYSMFEAVADEEAVAASANEVPPEASQPPAPAPDDWFAPPQDREAEPYAPEASHESAFDLDAAFQQVLPNKEDADEEHLAAEPSSEPDYAALTRGDWTGDAKPDAAFTDASESDGVDDAFATLDEMTGSLGEENSGSAAPSEDSYVAPDYIAAPQHVDALIGRTPDTGVPAIEEAPAAFVTETMAELYLQQGFRDEALAVYRQLLAMNPTDEVLAERVRSLEAPEPAPAETSGQADRFAAAPHADAAGQSVRAFLGVFARRRAPMRRRSNTPEAMPAPPQEETPLSALLGAPQTADVGSAALLAGAFAPNVETEVLPGRPTRAAADELSLGDVFSGGGESSGGRAASFDEFFGTGSADRAAPSPLDEEGSDMLQFTAWLEGLKKK